MGRAYSDIAFTPAVRTMQTRMGTRSVYAAMDRPDDRRDALTADEVHQLRAEGRKFDPHYAVRSRGHAAYLAALEHVAGAGLRGYADDRRFDAARTLALTAADAMFYVVRAAGVADDRIRFERFSPAASSTANRPLNATFASQRQACGGRTRVSRAAGLELTLDL